MSDSAERAARRIVDGVYALHCKCEIGDMREQEIKGVAAIIREELAREQYTADIKIAGEFEV